MMIRSVSPRPGWILFRLAATQVIVFVSSIAPILTACSSSSSPSPTALPSSSSSTPAVTAAAGTTPNWHQFTITKDDQSGSTALSSIEEMQSTGGFTFIFPSYLPAGTSTTMAVAAAAQTSSADGSATYGPAEEVMILSGSAGGPQITIQEQKSPISLAYAAIMQSDNATQTEVVGQPLWCLTEDVTGTDGTNPGLKCVTFSADRGYAFLFQWKADTPVPGLVSNAQRQEALKVIASTIEAPAYW
jgi:hypothetical protein